MQKQSIDKIHHVGTSSCIICALPRTRPINAMCSTLTPSIPYIHECSLLCGRYRLFPILYLLDLGQVHSVGKLPKNVAFHFFFNLGISTLSTCLETLYDRKPQFFKNSPNLLFFAQFYAMFVVMKNETFLKIFQIMLVCAYRKICIIQNLFRSTTYIGIFMNYNLRKQAVFYRRRPIMRQTLNCFHVCILQLKRVAYGHVALQLMIDDFLWLSLFIRDQPIQQL